VRGAQEPYRYEREVEDFLRWSPHVKNTRDKGVTALSRDQLAELQRLLTSFADTTGVDLDGESAADRAAEAEQRAEAAEDAAREASKRAERAEKGAREAAARPKPSARPVEHYDDLAAEEVIALLASLEHEDLQMLRGYERDHANRTRVLRAIESVLARGGSRV
jgi:hypothetical protein